MKKKILILVMMAFILAIFTLPASASCDTCIEDLAAEEPENHCSAHCTGDSVETCPACGDEYVASYCTATHLYSASPSGDGTHVGTCDCGDSYETSCTTVLVSTNPSTCVTKGYNTYKCEICGAVTEESLPLGDHSFPDEPSAIESPTCTTGGYSRWECESCDYSYESNQTAPLGHDWYKASTTPSTCVTQGYVTYNCTRCEEIDTEMLPLGDHSYSDEPTRSYSPTCTTAGYNYWQCESCDYSKTTDYTAALGHDWDIETIAATCEAAGINYKVCKRCGLDQSTTTPALGHVWGDEPVSCTSTCYFAGTAIYRCKTCGEEESRSAAKIDHIYVDGICTMCGLKQSTSGTVTGGSSGTVTGGTSTGGGTSGGSLSGGSFGGDFSDIGAKRVLSLLAITVVTISVYLIYVKYFATKEKKKRR